jgi:hypothetical protein
MGSMPEYRDGYCISLCFVAGLECPHAGGEWEIQ